MLLGEKHIDKNSALKKTKIVMAIPFDNIPQKDVSMVEKEVNKIVEKKLGIQVQFVATASYSKEVSLLLSGKEQLDIMAAPDGKYMEAYINGMLVPLDDYLEKYGQGIIEQVGRKNIECCNINNTLYGIPTNSDYACVDNCYMLRKDILDKYNIKAEDIKTYSDLEKVFALIKKNEPNLTILIPGYGTILSTQYYLVSNNGFRPGVHMNYGQNEKIDNIFETKEYMDSLKRIRKWYLKGYLSEDIFGETEPVLKRVKQGKIFAYTTKGKPGIESQDKTGEDNEMVCVKLGKASISYNSMSGHPYVITKNTISPELAMRVLNLFYTDADIMNLLSYGVEGIHYKKLNNGFITYADKEKKNLFLNNAWNMPNQFITYVWEGNDKNLWENLKKFNEESIQSCELGFNFDFSEVAAEYASVREIYKTYSVILENGLVNPEDGLQHMLQEMRENGLDRILALERKQFANWEKGKKKEDKRQIKK